MPPDYEFMHPYDSWGKIAAYFDGDGDIYFSDTSNQPYKLSLSIILTDQSLEQIKMIKEFLNRNGIITSKILKTSKGTAYLIAISRFDHVLVTMKALLPHLYKKANEIRAAIDYYDGEDNGKWTAGGVQPRSRGRKTRTARTKGHNRCAVHLP